MPIGPEKLLRLVRDEKIKLVENLDDRELNEPEGAGFDIRIGEVYKFLHKTKAFLGVTHRETSEVKLVAVYKKGKRNSFRIRPGGFVLIKTIEKVNLPKGIAGYTFTRTSNFRSGLQLLSTQIAPGYKGELTFGLKNVGPISVPIELGSRIAHVQFEWVDGGGKVYRGQWQGGRVSTGGKREEQI